MTNEKEPLRDRLTDALDDRRGLNRLMNSEEEPTIRERLVEASQMGQEPKDRLWAVIIVISFLVLILGGLMVETRVYLSEGRTLGYKRGAVDCLTVAVDNDTTFDLPNYCYDPKLVVHYPQGACEEFFPDVATCGGSED